MQLTPLDSADRKTALANMDKPSGSGPSIHKFTVTKPVSIMRLEPTNQKTFATGGKENYLRLYDLEDPSKPLFRERNVSQSLARQSHSFVSSDPSILF